MNLKKETLRKTTAFISALLFISSSTGIGMTGASAANVQAGKTSTSRSAGNSIVYNSNTPTVKAPVQTTSTTTTTSQPQENTTTTTTAASSTSTSTTTTATTTTTAKETKTLDLGADIPDNVKESVFNIIRGLCNVNEVERNGDIITITYNPDEFDADTALKLLNYHQLFGETLYHCTYNNGNLDYQIYYKLNNYSNDVVKINSLKCYVIKDNEIVEIDPLTVNNNNVYVKSGTTLNLNNITLANGYKIKETDQNTYTVDGKIEISNSEIKINNISKIKIEKTEVTIIITCENADVHKKYTWDKPADNITITEKWLDLDNVQIKLSAIDQQNTNNLIITTEISGETVTAVHKNTVYDGNLNYFLTNYAGLTDETPYKDNATIIINVKATPKVIDVSRVFTADGVDKNVPDIQMNLDSSNRISIPYIVVHEDKVYYLKKYLTNNNGTRTFNYNNIVADMNDGQNDSSVYKLSVNEWNSNLNSDDVPVTLYYDCVTDVNDTVRNELLKLLEDGDGIKAVNGILYVNEKITAYGVPEIDENDLTNACFKGKQITLLNSNMESSSMSFDPLTGNMTILNTGNNKISKVILMNEIDESGNIKPFSMTPFVIYYDGHAPVTEIKKPQEVWSSEKEFSFEFTVNDNESDMNCTNPSLADDVQKLKNAKDLASISYISVAGYRFEKPEGGWASSEIITGILPEGEESKYNVTLTPQLQEDETITFTAVLSLKDTAIKGVNEEINVYAVDVAGNSEASSAKKVRVMMDHGAPIAESITVEGIDSNGCLKKDSKLTVTAVVSDKYIIDEDSNYPYSDISEIVYTYYGDGFSKKIEKSKSDKNLDEDAVFDVENDTCKGYVSVEITDAAGNKATYYYCDGEVTTYKSKASLIVVDNTKPLPAEITAKAAEYIDDNNTPHDANDDKLWYKDYPNMNFKIMDDGEISSGISMLKFTLNGQEFIINEDKLTGESGYASLDEAAADFADENSCYLVFESANSSNTKFFTYLTSHKYPSVSILINDASIDLSKDGELLVKLVAVDHAGNESDPRDFKCYVDNTDPEVDGIFEKTSDDVKMYKYGAFANKKITIKVPISDGVDAPSSGYRSAEMIYVGEYGSENKYVASRIENGYAYFEIPEQTEGDFVYEGTMTVTLTDNVGNSTVSDTLLSPAPYESGYLVVENIAPSVSDTPVLKGENMYSKDVDGETQLWFSSDVNLDYSITDMESGISHVVIERKHDDKSDEIENSVYTELTDLTRNAPHTVSTETGVDGKFEFHVIADDNSGNRTTKDFTVYKDTSVPYVHSINFSNIIKNNDSVLLTDRNPDKYSHFHNNEYTATITVKDDLGASAGIDTICCELYNTDGTLFRAYTFDNTQFYFTGEEDTYAVEFVIPEGFKGDIKAWTTDKVNHKSAVVSPNGFVSEGNGTHDNAAYDHIGISLPSTDRRDTVSRRLYNSDVTASITVTDMHSGISVVRWRTSDNENWSEIQIDADGNITGASDGWNIEKSDRNIIQTLTRNITVTTDANDDFIEVIMIDNSNNSSESVERFSIDKQKPVINVTGIEKSNEVKYYNSHKTLNVSIAERNFNAPVVNNAVDTGFTADSTSNINTDQYRHTKNLEFNSDGRYSISITDTDLAGNISDEYTSGTFVIDTIAPKASVKVVKEDGSVVANAENTYIDSAVQAVIDITEVNFDPNSINISVNGKAYVPANWSGTEAHSVIIPMSYFSNDGSYTISVSGKDLAGNAVNPVKVSFTIDQKSPAIEISGVLSANKDEVAPVIEMSDQNYKSGSVKLYKNDTELKIIEENDGQNLKYVVDESGKYITASWNVENDKNGINRKLEFDNFAEEEAFDGSYRIETQTSDMADNANNESLEFSVNRFGSVFTINNADEINNKYLNEAPSLVITERNVDMHDSDSELIIIVDKGSNTVKLTEDQYTVSEPVQLEDKSGYEYTYTIHPEVFDQDLDYSVSIQSVDKAGNKNVSTMRGAEINFSLDTHKPEFKCDDLVDKAEFRQSEREFRINVNEKIKRITVKTSDGKILLDEESDNGENSYVFVMPASNSSRNVIVELTDLAGNKTVKTYKNLLITENVALYMLHKTWFKAVGASVIALLGALGSFIFIRKRKKNR